MFDYRSNPEKISLKYSGKVPEDYDISKMQYTFDFIYQVFKRDAIIANAIQGVSKDYNLSEVIFKKYLVENKYILPNSNVSEFSLQIKSYNTKSLKKILKKHGLKTSGKRERIEERIFENDLLGDTYRLSSKSRVFYRNKKRRIRIYSDYLSDHYYFDEFNEFYMDNYRKKEAKIPIAFIDMHISKSIEDEDHRNYIINNQIMAEHFLKKKNYRKMLEYVLKNYCMNLNPIWRVDELEDHVGLDIETYDALMFLKDELGKNVIINKFYRVWDSFDFDTVIVSKYDGYRYLKDLLNYKKDYHKINHSLDKRFYFNEDLKIKRITQKTLFDF